MNLWDRIKFSLSRFMYGRYGADEFSRAIVMASLILLIIGNITASLKDIFSAEFTIRLLDDKGLAEYQSGTQAEKRPASLC